MYQTAPGRAPLGAVASPCRWPGVTPRFEWLDDYQRLARPSNTAACWTGLTQLGLQ